MRVGLFQSCYPEVDNRQAPLGLGYLASYVTKYVPGVEFVIERDLDRLIDAKPDIVGFSVTTASALLAAKQATRVKEELGIPVVCGGPHPSALPTVLAPMFDAAIIGEGEITFAEMLTAFRDEKKLNPRSLAKISGLTYRAEDGSIVQTPSRDFMTELDSIPFPDRDQLFANWPHPNREYTIMTSRGCPYTCSFCSTTIHWGKRYRYHSKEYVCDEIASMRNKVDINVLQIWDDLFVTNKKRVIDLLNLIRERRLHEGMELNCFVRANLMDDELMDAMARTNFKVLMIGFESNSDAVLETLNKRGVHSNTNEWAAAQARKHGFLYSSAFILGSPGEKREDILASMEFVTSNMDVFDYVHFGLLQVLPGTQVWEWAKKLGISETNLDGVCFEPRDLADPKDFCMNRWPYMNEENMSREEVYSYLQIGEYIKHAVTHSSAIRKENKRLEAALLSAATPAHIAATIPFGDILREKAARRARQAGAWLQPPVQASNPLKTS